MKNFKQSAFLKVGLLSCSATVALSFTGIAHAQDASPTERADTGEIVVTAQRREQRLTEVPVSVQAVSSLAIDRAAISSATDLIRLTPSVNFQSGFAPNATSVVIRGVGSIAQEGGVQPSTALVVDDVALYSQAEFVTDFSDLERVEVLRGPQGTLFGKNATAGVINIVSKRPTDRYEGSFEGGYTTDDEYIIRGTGNIPLSDSIKVRVNAFSKERDFLIPNKSPIIRNQDKYGGGLSEKAWGFAGKVLFDLSPTTSFLLSGDYSHHEGSMGAQVILIGNSAQPQATAQANAGVVSTRDDPFTNNDAPNYSTSNGWGLSGALETEFSDSLSLKSITAYRDFRYDSFTNADGGPWGAWPGVGLLPNPDNNPFVYIVEGVDGLPRAPVSFNYFSQEIRLNYSKDALDLVTGGYMQMYNATGHNSVPYILPSGFTNNEIDYKINDDIYSAFADLTYNVSDTVSLFGGARFTYEKYGVHYNRQFWFGATYNPLTFKPTSAPIVTTVDAKDSRTNLSGRAGIRFSPNPDHSYYASYNRGYKGPAIDTSRTANAAQMFLKPEIANAFEIGTKHVIGTTLVNFAVYYQTTNDVQQSAVIPGTTSTRLQNTGQIRSYGAELDFNTRLSDAFKIDGGLAYVHATYQNFNNSCYVGQTAADGCNVPATGGFVQSLDGKAAQGTPRFTGRIQGTYEINTSDSLPFNAFIQASYTYSSEIQFGLVNDPKQREAGHSLVDATLGFTGKNDGWQLLLYGRNLTNEIYYSNFNGSNGVIGQRNGTLPRNFKRYFGAMLKLSF